MTKLLIFDAFTLLIREKLSQITHFCNVKLLAWKSSCVNFLTNIMSWSQGVEFVLIDTGDFWLFLICLEWLLVSCLPCLMLTKQVVVTNIQQFLLAQALSFGISSVAYFVSCVPETRVVLLCVPDTRVLCVSCLPFCVPERGTSETCGLDKRQATSNSYCERQASSHQTLNLHLFVLVSYTYTRQQCSCT